MKTPIAKSVFCLIAFGISLSAHAAGMESPWMVGENSYAWDQLSDAVMDAYTNNLPLKLVRTLTVSEGVTVKAPIGMENQELIIDLNGCMITSTVASVETTNCVFTVASNTTVRIVSSEEGGTIAQEIVSDGDGAPCTGVAIYGSLTIGRVSNDAGVRLACVLADYSEQGMSIVRGYLDKEGNGDDMGFYWESSIDENSELTDDVEKEGRTYYSVSPVSVAPIEIPDEDTPTAVSNALVKAGIPATNAICGVVTSKSDLEVLNALLVTNCIQSASDLLPSEEAHLADSFAMKSSDSLAGDDGNHLFVNEPEIEFADFVPTSTNCVMTVRIMDGELALKIAAAKLAEKVQKSTRLPEWSALESKDIKSSSGDGTDTVVLTVAPPSSTNGFLRVNIAK